jgi:GMP synthase-like glutamine amidotransferase
MARAFVLQTQDDVPPGLLAAWAARRGIELRTLRMDQEDQLPEPRAADFLVGLGSSASAAGGGPPWVQTYVDYLRAADAAAVPVLGICFGAQALSAALGGSVHRLATPELGWVTIASADEQRIPPGPWLAWHEDGFTLPPLAYELAANAFGTQAFCHRGHLAVQFHPEATPEIAAGWAAADRGNIARAGTDRAAVERDGERHAAAAARAAEILFDGFAARAGLVGVGSGA